MEPSKENKEDGVQLTIEQQFHITAFNQMVDEVPAEKLPQIIKDLYRQTVVMRALLTQWTRNGGDMNLPPAIAINNINKENQ